jgi:hypothetical protein
LQDLAKIVRSKNAGPFLVSVDVLFRDRATYEAVRASNVITPERIATLFDRDAGAVRGIYFWDAALAVKVTLRRTVSAGAVGDEDVYGAAMHMPLMGLVIPGVEPVAANDAADSPRKPGEAR